MDKCSFGEDKLILLMNKRCNEVLFNSIMNGDFFNGEGIYGFFFL